MSEYLGFEPTKAEKYYFISYNSDDSERVTGLLSLLNEVGFPIWYDYGLEPGSDEWEAQLADRIGNCQAFVMLITKNLFLKKSYVKIEYKLAKRFNKKIYSVILEPIDDDDIPEKMAPWWEEFTEFQCFEAFKYTNEIGVIKGFYRTVGVDMPKSAEKTISDILQKKVQYMNVKNDELSESYYACKMLTGLEGLFQSNPRHVFVFNELDQLSRDDEYVTKFTGNSRSENGISNCDIVLYFTFFESLYRAIKHNIISVEDIDDCFADRFFKFIHNQYIQENELYIVPGTYVNIFELYSIWKKYHVVNLISPRKIISFLKNEIPDYYLDNRLYLQEVLETNERNVLEKRFRYVNLSRKNIAFGYKEFVLKRLFPSDLRSVTKLQNDIISSLADDDLYVESTKAEYLESMLIDFCYGLFDKDILVAVCIIVLNRETERNLIVEFAQDIASSETGDISYVDGITFDTIQVSKNYRGFGIQKFFLTLTENLCSMLRAKYILASVSPQNIYSMNNFTQLGYSVLKNLRMTKGMYDNKERNILVKCIQNNK